MYKIKDGRCGVVVGILAYYARGREFDSHTMQTFVCMNMSVCIGLDVSMYNMYVFQKNVTKCFQIMVSCGVRDKIKE
jgi:hypothetical protein